MGKKSEPVISKCKGGENWTKVSFKPDLKKFNMTHLEDDVVALMRKRVFDLAGCLGKTVKVELNGKRVPVKSFLDYVDLYLKTANKSRSDPLPRFILLMLTNYTGYPPLYQEKLFIQMSVFFRIRIADKVNERWEVCVSLSEGQFQQVNICRCLNHSRNM